MSAIRKFLPLTIDTIVTRTMLMSPARFAALTEKERQNIATSRIVAPQLGHRGFGGVQVTFRRPIYKAVKSGRMTP